MGKIWKVIHAQFNKLANFFWTRDPIAQMQLEYDKSVEQLKEGRKGLEQYRGLVERVSRQVNLGEKKVQTIQSKIKSYLKAGDRSTAGQLAIQLKEAQDEIAENRQQLEMHDKAYENNLEKIKHASKNLSKIRGNIKKYEADLKMSQAEAEMAKLSRTFDFDLTTDTGELEMIVQEKIDLNRAKVHVAADLSENGIEEIQAEKAMEESMAEDLLNQFEVEMGLKTPETANIESFKEELGPEDPLVEEQKKE